MWERWALLPTTAGGAPAQIPTSELCLPLLPTAFPSWRSPHRHAAVGVSAALTPLQIANAVIEPHVEQNPTHPQPRSQPSDTKDPEPWCFVLNTDQKHLRHFKY